MRLRPRRPDLRVLYISGYAEATTATPLLQKPFTVNALTAKVREVLEAPGSQSL
jgi:hypothetical protein